MNLFKKFLRRRAQSQSVSTPIESSSQPSATVDKEEPASKRGSSSSGSTANPESPSAAHHASVTELPPPPPYSASSGTTSSAPSESTAPLASAAIHTPNSPPRVATDSNVMDAEPTRNYDDSSPLVERSRRPYQRSYRQHRESRNTRNGPTSRGELEAPGIIPSAFIGGPPIMYYYGDYNSYGPTAPNSSNINTSTFSNCFNTNSTTLSNVGNNNSITYPSSNNSRSRSIQVGSTRVAEPREWDSESPDSDSEDSEEPSASYDKKIRVQNARQQMVHGLDQEMRGLEQRMRALQTGQAQGSRGTRRSTSNGYSNAANSTSRTQTTTTDLCKPNCRGSYTRQRVDHSGCLITESHTCHCHHLAARKGGNARKRQQPQVEDTDG